MPESNRAPVLSPLGNRTYRHLFAAQVIALAGTGLTTVALALLAYDLAANKAAAVLGTALMLKMVAYVGIAPVAGGLAHRLPRKALLIALDLMRASVVLCFPWLSALWQVYVLVFLVNACSAGFTPLFQATIPDVLPDQVDYTRALSLSRLAYDLESLLSPLLAAAALAVIGYDSLFMINGLAFVASALLVLTAALPAPGPSDRGRGLWGNVSFGMMAYLRTPRLRGLFVLNWAVAAASAWLIVDTVVVARQDLGLSGGQTALLYGAAGGGSMAMTLLLPRWLNQWSERTVMGAGALLMTLGLAAFGGLASTGGWQRPAAMWAVPLLWALLGAGLAITQTPGGRLLRRSCASGDRNAYFSAQFAFSHGCWLICYPLAGWTSSAWGTGPSFLLAAALAGLSLEVAMRLWPRQDPVVLPHQHLAIEHDHPHSHDEHHLHRHQTLDAPGHGAHLPRNAQAKGTHSHWHRHPPMVHSHLYVIDSHHPVWPQG